MSLTLDVVEAWRIETQLSALRHVVTSLLKTIVFNNLVRCGEVAGN
jgi:hypothetical protein